MNITGYSITKLMPAKNMSRSNIVKRRDILSGDFEKTYMENFDRLFEESFERKSYSGSYMIKEIAAYRFRRFLEYERKREFESVFYAEKKVDAEIKSQNNVYKLTAYIDRVDKLSGNSYAIIDYKTGNISAPVSVKNFEVKSFQLIMYKYIVETAQNLNIAGAMLLSVKNSSAVHLPHDAYDKCLDALREVLDKINSSGDFECARDKTKCEKCGYFYICR